MKPSSYDMAHECMRNAERAGIQHQAATEAQAAQTYATLALVDEMREHRKPAEVATDEDSDPATRYIVAHSSKTAVQRYSLGLGFTNPDDAKALRDSLFHPGDRDVYRVSIEVVQQ